MPVAIPDLKPTDPALFAALRRRAKLILTIAQPTASGFNFRVTGVAPQLSTGIGVSVVAGPNLSLYANFDAVLPTGNAISQTIQAGLRWQF